jgi:hypothetical protein
MITDYNSKSCKPCPIPQPSSPLLTNARRGEGAWSKQMAWRGARLKRYTLCDMPWKWLYLCMIESAIWMACHNCGMNKIKSASASTSIHRSKRAEICLLGFCKRSLTELSPSFAKNSKWSCFLLLECFMVSFVIRTHVLIYIVSELFSKSRGAARFLSRNVKPGVEPGLGRRGQDHANWRNTATTLP